MERKVTKYIINGQTYASLEEIPPNLRPLVQDNNQNGIPDFFESSTPMPDGKRVISVVKTVTQAGFSPEQAAQLAQKLQLQPHVTPAAPQEPHLRAKMETPRWPAALHLLAAGLFLWCFYTLLTRVFHF